ncbi:hypothetical protein KM043_008695 [Ampulex compressa]|nr:hypothetical protein KM043_008695 [Ampulex compressa]
MAINAAKAMLKQSRSALLICDVQEKFRKAIFEFDNIAKNSVKLINAMKVLQVPMLVTEQYPKVLGSTIQEFDISKAVGVFPKMQFSMCTPEVLKCLSTICNGDKVDSVILMGIEAHVCIEQTAIDLRRAGFEVHVVADCSASRTQEDRLLAFKRMRDIGCHITTSENVIFKLLGSAEHKEFKNVQALIKTPSHYTGLAPMAKI